MAEVAQKWGWQLVRPGVYRAPEGNLDLECTGCATIRFLAEEGWKRHVAIRDKRIGPDDRQGLGSRYFVTEVHQKWAFRGRQHQRIALGRGLDFRARAFLNAQCVQRGEELPEGACRCGEPLPTRRHWLWDCPAFPREGAVPPEDSAAHGLVLRTLPIPQHRGEIQPAVDLPIAEALRRAPRGPCGTVLVATDGGVQEPRRPRFRTAASGLCILSPAGEAVFATAREVGGVDQTSFAAELHGAVLALEAAAHVQVPITIVIDNKAVQRGVASRLAGLRPYAHFMSGLWRRIEAAADAIPPGSGCVWVPAHGRHAGWRPEGRDARFACLWRKANDLADEMASSASAERFAKLCALPAAREVQVRESTEGALLRLKAAEEEWASRWYPDSGD